MSRDVYFARLELKHAPQRYARCAQIKTIKITNARSLKVAYRSRTDLVSFGEKTSAGATGIPTLLGRSPGNSKTRPKSKTTD